MCLDFPGRVVALAPDAATVDTQGRRRRASTLLCPDVAVGEWVLVAASTVVGRLEPGAAKALIEEISQATGDPP